MIQILENFQLLVDCIDVVHFLDELGYIAGRQSVTILH